MTIAVLASETQQKELLNKQRNPAVSIVWADSMKTLQMVSDASAYIDLAFHTEPGRIVELKKLLPKPVFIHSVTETTAAMNAAFIRINAWPGFLARTPIEICGNIAAIETGKEILNMLHWRYCVVPDIPGMVSARIIAAIINEAYYTWGEAISSKEEIDIAMKLGTNYPKGPFEWCKEIGIQNIVALLNRLSRQDERYAIAPALQTEATI
jgi:3-hydroxybutyryl-CoA dehydrogenase